MFSEGGKMLANEKKSKVAILGTAQHYTLAPFDDPEFEIWGVNDAYLMEGMVRWDRWFQIHDLSHYSARENGVNIETMLAQYASWDCPVYMFQKYTPVPNAVKFPYEKLIQEFGEYFNSTISWLIAFAMLEGFKEIHIYGVDMATGTEFGEQRPSCEYFLGLARGRGIKVHIPAESRLLKTKYLYGYQEEVMNEHRNNLLVRKQNCINNHEEAANSEKHFGTVKNQYIGAIAVLDELLAEL
jgi:hypothetical protein